MGTTGRDKKHTKARKAEGKDTRYETKTAQKICQKKFF
jgi:hypothetical protein